MDCGDLTGIVLSINNELYAMKNLIDGNIKLPDIINHSINISEMNLKKLPDFSNCVINGDFDCSWNHLIGLNGAPKYIDGHFDCSFNRLTSLEGAPKEVKGNFICSNNQLSSLEGRPKVKIFCR